MLDAGQAKQNSENSTPDKAVAPSAQPTQRVHARRKVLKNKALHRIKKLSDRDYKMLEYLSWGPSTTFSLGVKFFPLDGTVRKGRDWKKDQAAPQVSNLAQGKVSEDNRKFNRYVWQRLKQLEQAGYIQTKKGDNIATVLGVDSGIVALQEKGAVEVVLHYNYEPDNIKSAFPRDAEVLHDIMVASTIRKIIDEASHDYYKIEWVHTEYFVRKSLNKPGYSKKGSFFPDCRIRIVPHKGPAITFDIEIDAGSIGQGKFFHKVASFRNSVLVVSPNAARQTKLFKYLAAEQEKNLKKPLPGQINFALWNEFIIKGMRMGTVFQFPSGQQGVLPVVLQ